MGEWFPEETELVAELCEARRVDWMGVAHEEQEYARCSMLFAYRATAYRDFLKQYLAGKGAIPEIPLAYMSDPSAWEDMSLADILAQISGTPQEYQNYLKTSIDRYRTAVMKLLPATAELPLHYEKSIKPVKDKKKWERIRDIRVLDTISPDDLPKRYSGEFHFIDRLYSVKQLFQKAMILQKLQELVTGCMAENASGALAKQANGPAADRQGITPLTWRGTDEQLSDLAWQLEAQGYIKSYAWFVDRFGPNRLAEEGEWEGNANLLVYLLERLQGRRLFLHVPQSSLERVFGIKHYKQKKSGYEITETKKPKHAAEIDRILSKVFPNS